MTILTLNESCRVSLFSSNANVLRLHSLSVMQIGLNVDGSALKMRAVTSGCCEQVNIGLAASLADGSVNGIVALNMLSIQQMDGGSYRGCMTN